MAAELTPNDALAKALDKTEKGRLNDADDVRSDAILSALRDLGFVLVEERTLPNTDRLCIARIFTSFGFQDCARPESSPQHSRLDPGYHAFITESKP